MKSWRVAALDFPPRRGGIQTYLFELVRDLPGVTVVAPSHPAAGPWDAAAPFAVERISAQSGGSAVARVMLRTLLGVMRCRPKGVLLGHPKLAPLALALEPMGVPCAVCAYGMELTTGRFKSLERMGLRRARRVVTISTYTRECLVRCGVDGDRIRMVRPGVSDVSRPVDGVAQGPPTIVTVGRVAREEGYKGHDVLLSSLDVVAQRIPEVRWVVVGGGSGLEDLRRRVTASVHRDRVLLTGETDDAGRDRWYREAHVVAMPARTIRDRNGERFEGFGIVYLEAGLFARPVVAGRAGGAVDAVQDGVTGLLVDPEDPRAVGEAVLDILTHPDRAKAMGAAGRRRALDEFSWTSARRSLVAALSEVES